MREKLIELLETVVSPNELLCDGEVLVSTSRVADHLIANGVTIQKWIPVSERLPEPFEIVIVYDKNEKYVSEAYMTKHKEWVGIHMKSTVTHWMPLPEPPKGE